MVRIREVTIGGPVEELASLARSIWIEHYTPIIGREQVDYMLDRFQSPAAIRDQLASGVRYFLLREGTEAVGYFAVEPREACLFLSKIYIRKSHRGRGFGRKAMARCEAIARKAESKRIELTVNKGNRASIRFYEHLGFQNEGPTVKAIGSGFVMDDYRMAKTLSD